MSERRGNVPQSASSDQGSIAVPPAHVVLWSAILGALVGLGILFADAASWDGDDFDLANEGPFLLWAAAIAAQTMAWVLVFPVITSVSRRWRTPARAHSREVRAATGALLFLGVAIAVLPPLIGELPETVPHRGIKTAVLNLTAFGLAIYAARAMWYAAAESRALSLSSAADLGALLHHRRLRADLELLLGILGLLVTLAVIASAALRALTEHVDPDEALPAQSVILYGLILSLVLALVYVPAYLTMLRCGQTVRDRVAPLLALDDAGFAERLAWRDRLGAFLGLDVAATASFRAGVAVLSPLIGSLTSLLPALGG
jgi:hypothetical protein